MAILASSDGWSVTPHMTSQRRAPLISGAIARVPGRMIATSITKTARRKSQALSSQNPSGMREHAHNTTNPTPAPPACNTT